MTEFTVPGGYFTSCSLLGWPGMAIWLKQALLWLAECLSKALHGPLFSVDQG